MPIITTKYLSVSLVLLTFLLAAMGLRGILSTDEVSESSSTLIKGTSVVSPEASGHDNKLPADIQPTGACSLTINRIDVSGCYSVSGVSKATVSVEVGWENAPTDETIIVSTAGQSVTITPGSFTVTYPQPTTLVIEGRQTIVTPQVVAFEVTLTGAASSSSVVAQFSGTPACTATQTYSLPAACPPTPCNGQLGGMVFRDFNADGIRQSPETQGVSSVTVTAFDCNGKQYGPVITDQFGKYTFTDAAISYPVRVEFSDLPGVDVATIYGTNSKSNVQFVNQASCSVDLGVANPTLYCQSNPTIFIPCYTYGDPLNITPSPAVSATALSANADALVSFPYDESNTAATGMTHLSEAGVMGTVWGLGYNRLTKDLFTGATLHRHAGLGPLGIGGIYVTHTKSATVTTQNFIKLSDIGVDVGDALVPVNGAGGRELSADKTKPSHDIDVFPLIGKVGIGGLEIAEDGKTLWFVNLYDKKLYSIDLSAYNTSGTLPTNADVHSYAIPDPACTGGSFRPWALHVSGGKLYVGSVCDALDSQNKSDMRAYVYAFDPTVTTFTPIFDFPLTYPKGYGISPKNSPGQAGADSPGWFPWTDTFADLVIPTSTAIYKSLVHPQPILADIEFDIDGSMVLGFADRTGLQGGFNNYSTDPTETQLYTVNPAAGDILRAYYSNGSYILENNGKVGPFTGTGVNNNQGPGFGEFYDDNYFDGSKFAHTELALGGLALKPGSGYVIGATIDPVATRANSGGVKYWNNETGVAEAAAIVYSTGSDPGTFAKAAGLGELDLNCDLLEVIEIGNRVWVDTDKDGVQDPCEKALANVTVDLYKGKTKIASTTTNADGEYYFSNKGALKTGTWLGTDADTTLLANTGYSLVFGATQFSSNILTVDGSKLNLTVAKSTVAQASNLNDSDASIATVAGITAPVISLTTGNTGFVNHNFDVGFTCVSTTVASVSITPATCNTATQTALSNGKIELTGIQCADKAFLITTAGVPSYTATGSEPVSASAVSFTGLANPTSTSGTSYSVVLYNGPCCYTVVSALLPQTDCFIPCNMAASVTLPVCNSATNQYILTGMVSLTAARAGSLTITDGLYSTTVAVAANEASVPFSLTGILSDGLLHTVSVVSSATACGTISTTYTAPIACTVCTVALTTKSLPDGEVGSAYSQSLSVSGGSSPYSYSVVGSLPEGLTLEASTGVISGTPTTASATSFSVVVTDAKACSDVQSLTITVAPRPVCSLTVLVGPDNCDPITNTYFIKGTVSSTNATVNSASPQTLTVSVGASSTIVTMMNDGPVSFTLTGLNSDGLVKTVTVVSSATACGTTSVTYTAPNSCTIAPAGLGDFVWLDTNRDGIQDSGEPGIPGVEVTLYVNGVVSLTTTTDASGLYSFTGLTPGNNLNYVVGFTAPADFSATGQNAGLDDANDSDADLITGKTQSVTLAPGELNLTIDAGFYTPTAGLGNFVWLDTNRDGIQDSGEPGIPGVTVTLISNATVVASTTTNASGLYSFTGLTPGVPYSVSFTAPATYTSTSALVGGDDTKDSDANPITGVTRSVTLAPGETNPNLDAGFYLQPASLTLVVSSAPVCNTATNNYTATAGVSLTNLTGNTTLTLTDNGITAGTLSLTTGQTSASFSLSGLSNAASHTLIATLTDGTSASVTYEAPASCTVCSLSLTTASLANGQVGSPYNQTLATTGGATPYSYTVAGGALPAGLSLEPTTGVISGTPVSASISSFTLLVTDAKGCTDEAALSIIISDAPVCSLTLSAITGTCDPATNQYSLTGTISLTNTGTGSLTITDGSVSIVLAITANQTTATYSLTGLQSDGLTHTVSAVLSDCGSSSLTYTAPQSCSVACQPPVHVCKGTDYAILLTAPVGQNNYQWYLNGAPISGATLNSYTATQAGSYSVVVNNNVGGCTNGSCCPVIIVEDSIATYQAQAQAPTCSTATNSSANTDGRILVTNWKASIGDTTHYFFQVSLGGSFNPAQLVAGGTSSPVPASGVLVADLANPTSAGGQLYTVRITNALGCYRDVVVNLLQTSCTCPPAKCVPMVITRTR